MTKKDFELIAEAIREETRATVEVYKMIKATNDNEAREDLDTKLQEAWGISLAIASRLQQYPKFDRTRFLNACGTSPQNWRYMNWVNGSYVNTSNGN